MLNKALYGFIVLVFSLDAALVNGEDINPHECVEAGYETGLHRGKLFCDVLEAASRGQSISAAPIVNVQFCELLIAQSCREGFLQARSQSTLCDTLINADWNNAVRNWQNALDVACPIPQIVSCPFRGAAIHKYVWCKHPLRRTYFAYYQGKWWQFIGRDADSDNYPMHRIRDSAGNVVKVYSADLTLVQTW